MHLRIWTITLLLVIVAGGAAWDWNQHEALVKLRTTVGTGHGLGQSPTAAMQAQPEADGRRASPGQTDRAATWAPEPTTRTSPDPKVAAEIRKLAELQETAELRKLAQLDAAVAIERGFAPLLRTLATEMNVPSAQIEEFKALLVQRELAVADPQNSPATAGDAGGMANIVSAAVARIDEQIKQTLGESGYALYFQRESALAQRNTAELVARSLDVTATPFSPSQTEQLVATLALHPAPAEVDVPGQIYGVARFATSTSLSTITDEAVAASADFLAVDQLQALRLVQTQQQAQQRLFTWLDRLQRPSKSGSGGAR
jgi:hypothetical protein